MMRLVNPYYLLVIIPVLFFIYLKIKRYENKLRIPTLVSYEKNNWVRYSRYLLRGLTIIILVIALARPQHYRQREVFYGEGIDIMIALDTSTSMLAEDFKPNRLEAAKQVIRDFVRERKSDRVGLTIFAAKSINRIPFTSDHDLLERFLEDITFYMLPDGTAIGTAIANSLSRLKESPAKSKVIILLTDGVNNSGQVSPEAATDTARALGVKIYTIGVGTHGKAYSLMKTPYGMRRVPVTTEIDEDLLRRISSETGAKYYRATDNEKLQDIFKEISKLEKTKIESEVFGITKEYYQILLFLAMALYLLEIVVFDLWFKRIP